MRAFFLFFFCISTVSAQTQIARIDTFDLKRSAFIKSYWTETNMADTLLNTKDSLVIHFKNQQGYFRQKIDIKIDTGCV